MYISSGNGFTVILIGITLVLSLVGPSMAAHPFPGFYCYKCKADGPDDCKYVDHEDCESEHSSCLQGKTNGKRVMGCSTREEAGCENGGTAENWKCYCRTQNCNEGFFEFDDMDPATGGPLDGRTPMPITRPPFNPTTTPSSSGTTPLGTLSSCLLLGSLILTYLTFNGYK